jgi:hypothetical protein
MDFTHSRKFALYTGREQSQSQSPSDSEKSDYTIDSEPSAPAPSQKPLHDNTIPFDVPDYGFNVMTGRKPRSPSPSTDSQISESPMRIYYYGKDDDDTPTIGDNRPSRNNTKVSNIAKQQKQPTITDYTWLKRHIQRRQEHGVYREHPNYPQLPSGKGKAPHEPYARFYKNESGPQLPSVKQRRKPKKTPGDLVWRPPLTDKFKAARMKDGVGFNTHGLKRRMQDYLMDSWM